MDIVDIYTLCYMYNYIFYVFLTFMNPFAMFMLVIVNVYIFSVIYYYNVLYSVPQSA
jgi:hypothetical protein